MTDGEVLVLGGGAAGLAAANTARRAGMRVTLVSEGAPGGDCTFTGCVPSKTLIEAAEAGLSFSGAMTRVRRTVSRVAATEDEDVLRSDGIDVVRGRARFVAERTVEVDGHRRSARRVVLATGGRPAVPPVPGLGELAYLTTDTVFDLMDPPTSLVVLGGGPVGCELAQALARLGVGVTLVEQAPRLLPGMDPDASDVLARVLRSDGVRLRTGAPVREVRSSDGKALVELADGEVVRAERLLVATGRRPNTEGLGLDAVGVRTDRRGHVLVDRHMATTARGVSAAGDVTGVFGHTHAAYAMGRVAVLAGTRRTRRPAFEPDSVPRVVFTNPEVATVGRVEHELADTAARAAYLPMSEVDRAVTADAEAGFVKLFAGPRGPLGHLGGGRVLGASIVAPRAGEMIHEPALAMRTGMFAGRLAQTVHAYPSWSMAVQRTAAQFVGTHGGRTARPVAVG
ncbi:Pyruvate/2-oxoglutarate dehydrogenase complex, dihydrolipoamide dehydrogenase (E3) component [Actinopolyspora lacussalsi subsp. righensis]|uniref:Pyruvate/2-oxoglutarate dehydrogenase complex, dihydrolipoamide dehydrogenase (E3) component n=1 Tax=Actinopolyspora righensis TaxID=995060 RepID=A0A1I7A8R6_9ACTN|nr:NAD(P)/FAD-dependent oxidoreductase [Actinopolyspora righensis]SFT71298.1 Pyruvate/2-oxoglutarate dehydrogenase complex, dihydrolipoamide dehydrogenase (E3) component [Actinopolyspora righensis]